MYKHELNSNLKYYINKWYYNKIKQRISTAYYQIHLTKSCQNRCRHCYYREIKTDQKEIDPLNLEKIIIKIAKNAREKDLNARIDFTGGDPFLYKYLDRILSCCRSYNVKFGFKCNPDFFLKNCAEDINNLIYDCCELGLSIDGDKLQHDYWRGEGSFDKTFKAACLIKNLNYVLRITMTLSRENISSLFQLVNFLLSEKICLDDFGWVRYWSGEEFDNLIDTKMLISIFDEYVLFLNSIFENEKFYIRNLQGRLTPRIFFGFNEPQWFPYFVEHGIISNDLLKYAFSIPNSLNCAIASNAFIIDPDLKIYRCRKLSETCGNYLNGDEPNKIYDLSLHTRCINCLYFNVCGGCTAIQKSIELLERDNNCIFFKEKTAN